MFVCMLRDQTKFNIASIKCIKHTTICGSYKNLMSLNRYEETILKLNNFKHI